MRIVCQRPDLYRWPCIDWQIGKKLYHLPFTDMGGILETAGELRQRTPTQQNVCHGYKSPALQHRPDQTDY
jgi:hypothetical protein